MSNECVGYVGHPLVLDDTSMREDQRSVFNDAFCCEGRPLVLMMLLSMRAKYLYWMVLLSVRIKHIHLLVETFGCEGQTYRWMKIWIWGVKNCIELYFGYDDSKNASIDTFSMGVEV